jgi:uncharacterized membrane protein
MRSWRSAAVSILVLVAACGTDVRPPDEGGGDDSPIEPIAPDACEKSYLDYNNFGAPFVINWCRGCHSSSIPQGQRQKAPLAVNFDSVDDVRNFAERIEARAASIDPTMPPAGGPSEAERALLREWIECGTR